MTIETLDDWNMRLWLCECCGMPECPVPDIETERLSVPICGEIINSHFLLYLPGGPYHANGGLTVPNCVERYQAWFKQVIRQTTSRVRNGVTLFENQFTQTKTHSYSGEPDDRTCTSQTTQQGNAYADTVGSFSYSPTTVTRAVEATESDGSIFRQTTTYEYSNPCNYDQVLLELNTRTDWSTANWPIAAFDPRTMACPEVVLSLTKARFRFSLPRDFKGSYFKITWDEVFFPVGYTPSTAQQYPPEVLRQNVTLEWQGPGNPEVDHSWNVGGWNPLAPPNRPGQTRIVNIRFVCHRSKLGVKPQTMGEAYDIPST